MMEFWQHCEGNRGDKLLEFVLQLRVGVVAGQSSQMSTALKSRVFLEHCSRRGQLLRFAPIFIETRMRADTDRDSSLCLMAFSFRFQFQEPF
mmetsp:Transcript_24400/g.64188  ORF Transcript_24400/g.64188 Transcript_24400/m.64188 type:complete len:92 (-) Transcript_24400:94-369(-)